MSSTINWPAGLPLPSAYVSGYLSAPVAGTRFEAGKTRMRRRFSGLRKTWNVSWDFTMTEYEAFLAFFNHTVDAGTAYFNLTLPVDSEMTPQVVRMMDGGFQERYIPHMRMIVEATLESEPINTASEAWLFVFEFSGGDFDGFLEFCNAFHTFVHETLPLALNGD